MSDNDHIMSLDSFQYLVGGWVADTFGQQFLMSKKERAFRALEEATEAIQQFLTKEEATAVINQVYNKPVEPLLYKEIGGALFTMLALAESNNLSAYQCLKLIYQEVRALDKVKLLNKHLTKPARDTSLDIHTHEMIASHKEARNV